MFGIFFLGNHAYTHRIADVSMRTQLENQAVCKVFLACSILGNHAYTHRIADLNMRTQLQNQYAFLSGGIMHIPEHAYSAP